MNKNIISAVVLGVVTSLIASYLIAKYHSSASPVGFTKTSHDDYYQGLYDWLNGSPYANDNGVINN